MRILKVLIVEDEVLIAETIRLYLNEYGYETSAICISYDEAIEAFHLYSPDIILLDIRLFGEKSGIDVARYLNTQQCKPPYIFLTSQYDKRILDEAIQTLPYGYITKPFLKETLWTSIKAACELHKSRNEEEDKIVVFDGKFKHIISTKEILYLESEHVYTKFVLRGNLEILERISLENCEKKLSNNDFFRCHRSFILNINGIQSWEKDIVRMVNGISIPVSRSKRNDWISLMHNKL